LAAGEGEDGLQPKLSVLDVRLLIKTDGGVMSDKEIVVSAPMSFQGALARSRNWFWHDKPIWFKAVFGWVLIVTIVPMWWTGIVMWYILFGLLLVPYRLIRRGSRRRKAEAKRHKQILEALNRREEK
jgi:uncharacterized membrane protein (UPF0182 family)